MNEMPTPPNVLTSMQARLELLSAAIEPLGPLTSPDSLTFNGSADVVSAQKMLVNTYLQTREEFEEMRANFEHNFMTWHSSVLQNTDARFRVGNPTVPPTQPAKWHEPKWAESVPTEADLDKESATALESLLDAKKR